MKNQTLKKIKIKEDTIKDCDLRDLILRYIPEASAKFAESLIAHKAKELYIYYNFDQFTEDISAKLYRPEIAFYVLCGEVKKFILSFGFDDEDEDDERKVVLSNPNNHTAVMFPITGEREIHFYVPEKFRNPEGLS